MKYVFKVFLDCQSFSSQGTVPIRDTPFLHKYLVSRAEKGAEVMFSVCDTPLMASFRVSWRNLGSGYVCVVRDTLFWWKKPVSRTGNRGKTCHFVRDIPFFAETVCVAC